MAKVQELNHSIQTLITEKHLSKQQSIKHIDHINILESIVASGEIKLSNLGKQLSKSLEEQERRIRKERELKMELHGVRLELESLRSRRTA